MDIEKEFPLAIEWLAQADGLLIAAGAGMSADSGLPDFQSPSEFWKAYPALRDKSISLKDLSTPAALRNMPYTAWGFYGHQLNLYRETKPHTGFDVLLKWSERMKQGSFVFTSNVDGQFQKAGFSQERIVECQGAMHVLQCLRPCMDRMWEADHFFPQIDADTYEFSGEIPRCPHCGGIARPNLLMSNDFSWIGTRTAYQQNCLMSWLSDVKFLVTIEVGASRTGPTVRNFCESNGRRIIRINRQESSIPSDMGIGITAGAAETLHLLDLVMSPASGMPSARL